MFIEHIDFSNWFNYKTIEPIFFYWPPGVADKTTPLRYNGNVNDESILPKIAQLNNFIWDLFLGLHTRCNHTAITVAYLVIKLTTYTTFLYMFKNIIVIIFLSLPNIIEHKTLDKDSKIHHIKTIDLDRLYLNRQQNQICCFRLNFNF